MGDIVIPGASNVGKLRATIVLNIVTKSRATKLRMVSGIATLRHRGAGRTLHDYPIRMRATPGSGVFCVRIHLATSKRASYAIVRSFRARVAHIRRGNIRRPLPRYKRTTRRRTRASQDRVAIRKVLRCTRAMSLRRIHFLLRHRVRYGATVSRRKLGGD